MNEQQVREHVRKLSRFYTDALIYTVVNLGLILIWAISGGGYFWPIWVIIGWGIGLGVHAFSLGLIPQMNAMVPFMTSEWEDQEVRRILETKYKGKEKEEKKAPNKVLQTIKEVGTVIQMESVKTATKKPKSLKKTKAKAKTKTKAIAKANTNKKTKTIKAPKVAKKAKL